MQTRSALTLLELIAVVCILAALGGLVIPLCSQQLAQASETATQASLVEVQQAIQQYWHDTKFIAMDGVNTFASESQRFEIDWLFVNPVTNDQTLQFDPNAGQGWNGPYVFSATAQTSSPDLIDGWNRALQVQYVNPSGNIKDVRIVSAGPNGIIEISTAMPTSLLTTNNIGDDLYVAIMLR